MTAKLRGVTRTSEWAGEVQSGRGLVRGALHEYKAAAD